MKHLNRLSLALIAAAALTAFGAAAVARSYDLGTECPVLPPGCAYTPVGGAAYYSCNGAWFLPGYGANGMYHRVVPAP